MARFGMSSLSPSFVNWLIAQGVNPCAGEVFFLAPTAATTSLYTNWLKAIGVRQDCLFTSLTSAEDAMYSNRGDVLCVLPGDHTVTASITWDKNNTTIIGMGSVNQSYQPGTLTAGGVRLTCTTSGISEILNITGHYVTMKNLGTYNSYSGATNYCDVRIAGRNFYGSRLSLRGGNGATQLSTLCAGVPLIVDTSVAGAGNGLLIEDSVIGSSGNSARSKGPGCIYFVGGAAAGFGMHFNRCTLSTRIETATNNSVGLVYLGTNYAVDRELYFKDCLFYNFVENLGTGPTYVFRDSCTTTHQIVLHNCAANKGFTSWTDAATYLSSNSETPALAGGIGVNS